MTEILIGLGSNLGHREGNVRGALRRLAAGGLTIVRVSSLWESGPVPPGQPSFVNAAALIEAERDPFELLALVKEIEYRLGRRAGRRWGPRPIDLDLLSVGSLSLATDRLTLPHALMFKRAFVLAPLLEVLDGRSDLHRRCLSCIQQLDCAGVRRLVPPL